MKHGLPNKSSTGKIILKLNAIKIETNLSCLTSQTIQMKIKTSQFTFMDPILKRHILTN